MRTVMWAVISTVVLSGCGGGSGESGDSGAAPQTAMGNSMLTTAIAGTVIDKNGTPIAGAIATAYRTNDHTDHSTITDSAGHFSFTGLSGNFPYGDYEVRVEKSGFGFYPTAGSSSTSIVKADYNALFRMVIAVSTHGSFNVTDANFTGLRSGDKRITLPRTGQTTSYAAGDDAALAQGAAWPSTRFVDHSNGTVTDALTGLVWLKDAGCMTVSNWTTALASANQLANGTCGLTDGSTAGQWRMPNVAELESLIDTSRINPAVTTGHSFTNIGTAYWSSTTYRGVTTTAWVIRFSDGRYINDSIGNYKATAMNGLWAVKSGASAGTIALPATGQFMVWGSGDDAEKSQGIRLTSPRFIDNGNGTIADTVTGLTWLKRANCVHQTWSDAIAAINSLASGQCGLSDGSTVGQWRMPNRAELLSLVDRAETNQALRFNTNFYKADNSVDQPIVFSSYIENEFYWTSTTDAADTSYAWTVYSCDYGVYDIAKSSIGYSLAVR